MKNTDQLAKLLATENITVTRNPSMSTAAFDTENRVLHLPVWKQASDELASMLTGHEVGHALWTDNDCWESDIMRHGVWSKQYFNVIEDVRIDKLIQQKYPGLKKDYAKGKVELFKSGFFGTIDLDEIQEMSLMNRLNLRFKVGPQLGIKFSEAEQRFVDTAEKLESWEDVVKLTDDLIDFIRAGGEDEEDEQEDGNAPGESDDSGDEEETEDLGVGSSDTDEGEEEESDESESGKGEGEEEESDESESAPQSGEGEEEDESNEAIPSDAETEENAEQGGSAFDNSPLEDIETQEAYDSNMETLIDDSVQAYYQVNLPSELPPIVGHKEIVALCEEKLSLNQIGDESESREINANYYSEFKKNFKSSINHMAREFEMRKKATEFARTTYSKSGVIDTVKMNNYKFSDDIFLRMSDVKEGKSHGFIIYVDWSGSMSDWLKPTGEQLLLLVEFCRKVNVPFEVYAFQRDYTGPCENYKRKNIVGEFEFENFFLLNFFSSTMSRSQHNSMAEYFLGMCNAMSGWGGYQHWWVPKECGLSGTNLDATILNHPVVHASFRKENRVDIVNTFFLTDGVSHSSEFISDGNFGPQIRDFGLEGKSVFQIRNKKTGKMYEYKGNNPYARMHVTEFLLKTAREETGDQIIGYRIVNPKQSDVINVATKMDYFVAQRATAELRKKGYAKVPGSAYSEFFVLNGKMMSPKTANLDKSVRGAKKTAIRNAFKKATAESKFSRPMLTELMELVS